MAGYRKAFVASVGAIAIILSQVFGVVVPGGAEDAAISVFDSVVVLLTTFGVYRVPNEPLP